MSIYIILSLICISGLAVGLYRRRSIWLKGTKQSAQTLPASLILTIPKRYLEDLHHIVARDKTSATMHMFLAGGVLLVTIAVLIASFTHHANWLLVIGSVLMLIGLIFHTKRRENKKQQLSKGSFLNIPFTMCGLIAGLWLELIFQHGIFNLAGQVLMIICTVNIFWSGLLDKPLKHMLSGAAHLAFHPRQQRFDTRILPTGFIAQTFKDTVQLLTPARKQANQPTTSDLDPERLSTDLLPLELPNEMGADKIQDFPWNQVLSFDACIECGRCQAVCPAYAAGQPLNPKKVIQDLLISASGKTADSYTGHDYPNIERFDSFVSKQDSNSLADRISDHTLYACTTCRACVYECPMMIEQVDAIVDMRRHRTLNHGGYNANSQEVLDNLRHTDTISGFKLEERSNWALGANIPLADKNTHYQVLLLSGESGFDLRSQNTLKQLAELIQKSGKTLAVLPTEPDVGDLARRMGDEEQFQRLAYSMIAQLSDYQFETLVTNDPHVYHSIKNEYPSLGGTFKIQHHSEYLNDLIASNRLQVNALNQSTTYHDPCYLGRYNALVDAPRQLLNSIGVEVVEMEKSGCRSRCCGWGGGAAYADVPGDARIPDMRMQDIRETEQSQVVVACPNCMTMLEGVVEPRPDVLDIVELVHKAVTP